MATKNEQFLSDLQAFLKAFFKQLKWQSNSSGEDVDAVRIPWYRVMRWRDESDGVAETRLTYQYQNDVEGGKFIDLFNLFADKKLVSFKRAVKGKDGYYDLYILAYFGWWYVGIKTTLVEL